jgi:hypothetical protein
VANMLRGETAKSSKVEHTNSKLLEQYELEMSRLGEEIKKLQLMNEVNLTKVSKSEASVSSQARSLQQEADRLREENKAALQDLAQSREENARMKTLLSKASDEMDRLNEERSRMEQAMRCKQGENEVLLSELIQAKLAVGETSAELDEAKQAMKKLKASVNVPRINGNGNGAGTASSSGQPKPRPPPNLDSSRNPSTSFSSNSTASTQRSSASGPSNMLVSFPTSDKAEAKKPSNPFADMSANGLSSLKRGFGTVSNGISHLGSSVLTTPGASSGGGNDSSDGGQQAPRFAPFRANY